MADVFVSYSRSDKARVAPLVAAIQAKGWSVWWDPAIDAGQQFDDQIDAELQAASAVLLCLFSDELFGRPGRRTCMLGPVFENLAIGFLNHAKADPDLDPLRDDPRFKAMVAAAEARLAATGLSE
jgi:hypothetical protein